MTVGPRQMETASTSPANPNAPVALLLADKTSGKAPMRVAFQGSRSFDPNGEAISYAWTFGDGGTSASADTVYTFTEVGQYTVRFEGGERELASSPATACRWKCSATARRSRARR